MRILICSCLLLVLAAAVFGLDLEKRAYQMREDFGSAPLYDCTLNYYYYIPCPTYSWFWGFTGWDHGDIVGHWFDLHDFTMFYSGCPDYVACTPCNCYQLEQFRVLDFAGYGTIYPGLYEVQFDIYCSDEQGCPIGPPLWTSLPWVTAFGWNYIPVNGGAGISLCECVPPDPALLPRFLITATHVGADGGYPEWGSDNISGPVETACLLHDYGCCPALFPRPEVSHYPIIHSGYYGPGFLYCPPLWFCDGADETPDCSQYGFVELAWRVYVICSGPTGTDPSTWGNIKSMYR